MTPPERASASTRSRRVCDGSGREIERYRPYGVDSEKAKLATRWRRSFESEPYVEPVAAGIYHFVSESGKTYVIDLDGYAGGEERAVCECSDYRYRCAEEGFDCKHILAVKRLIRDGVLPPAHVSPVEWLRDRLDEFEMELDRLGRGGATASASHLEEQLGEMRDAPFTTEYREMFLALSEALSAEWTPPNPQVLLPRQPNAE